MKSLIGNLQNSDCLTGTIRQDWLLYHCSYEGHCPKD